MDHKSLLLREIEENYGIIKTSEAVSKGIRKNAFKELIDEGKIIRISEGLYGFPEEIIDEYLYFSSRLPNGIYSHETALFFWNLHNKTPTTYHMSVKVGSNVSRIKERGEKIIFHYVKEDFLNLGLTETTSPYGRKIRIYDMERSILDAIKSKDKMDKQVFTESIKNYFASNEKNLINLSKYATKMNLQDEVKLYSEVLI